MTDQTIPPCPVCGVVPVKHAKNDRILLCGCFEEYGAMMTDVVSLQKYQLMCVDMLGRAMRDIGIETVEQLKARLAPDPRVVYGVRMFNEYEHSPVVAVVVDKTDADRIVEHTKATAMAINEIECYDNHYRKTKKSEALRKTHYSFVDDYDATHESWDVVEIPVIAAQRGEGNGE